MLYGTGCTRYMRAVHLIMERLSFSPSIQNDRWGAVFYYKRGSVYNLLWGSIPMGLWWTPSSLPPSLPLMNPLGLFTPRPDAVSFHLWTYVNDEISTMDFVMKKWCYHFRGKITSYLVRVLVVAMKYFWYMMKGCVEFTVSCRWMNIKND